MTHPYPVYKEISELLNTNPEVAKTISLEQLKPIIELSKSATGILLDEDILQRVEAMYLQRAQKPRAKLKIKAVVKTEDPFLSLVKKINKDYHEADNLSQDELKNLIGWSDERYYTPPP